MENPVQQKPNEKNIKLYIYHMVVSTLFSVQFSSTSPIVVSSDVEK